MGARGRRALNPRTDDLWLVCGTGDLRRQLEVAGVPYRRLDDLLSPDDCRLVDNQATAIARSWYRRDGADLSLLEGVSLGTILEPQLRTEPILCCLKVLHALHQAHAVAPHSRRLIAIDTLNAATIEALRESGLRHQAPLVIYYGRPIIAVQVGALRTFAEAHGLEWLAEVTAVDRLHVGVVAPRRVRLRQQLLTAAYCALAGIVRIRSRATRSRATSLRPRVLFSTYNVTLQVLRRWLSDRMPVFDVALTASYPPRAVSCALLLRGARLLRPAHLSQRRRAKEYDRLRPCVAIQGQRDHYHHCAIGSISYACAFDVAIRATITHAIAPLAASVIGFQEALKRAAIQAVVVPYDTPLMERALVCVAQALGIPTLVTQHGHVVAPECTRENLLADRLAVWSGVWRDIYSCAGRSAESIVVTGNPSFDRYADRCHTGIRCGGQCLTVERPNILVLTDPLWWTSAFAEEDAPQIYLRTVLEALARTCPGCAVTVKLHPSESRAYYRIFEHSSPFGAYRLATGAIDDYLRQSHLVVGTESTALLEALMAGIPVISVNLSKRSFGYPFDGHTEIPVVRSGDELGATAARLLAAHGAESRFGGRDDALRACGVCDGGSTDRLYSAVTQLLTQGDSATSIT